MRRSVYEIRDKVLSGKRLVLNPLQLSNLALIPREHAKVYAGRMVKKGFAHRLAEGVISFTDDPFVIASQLIEPSYISFIGALYLQGMIQQIPAIVECVTTRNSLRLERLKIEYHKVRPSLFYGYERIERYGGYVFVAKPAKAVIDLVYFGLYPREIELDLNKVELASMVKAYRKLGDYRAKRVVEWVEKDAG